MKEGTISVRMYRVWTEGRRMGWRRARKSSGGSCLDSVHLTIRSLLRSVLQKLELFSQCDLEITYRLCFYLQIKKLRILTILGCL